MKLANIVIEWGLTSDGRYVFLARNGENFVSGHADTLEAATRHCLTELPNALDQWAERDLAREAFCAGSGYEPGHADEAFKRWWADRKQS